VINLGGGSLDVAIITMQEQVFEVKSMFGDNSLGGVDFVQRLIDYSLNEFKARFGIDISGNLLAREKLRVHCERAKKLLSQDE
jgi:heat shock 70kDa protein 1/2/6/8